MFERLLITLIIGVLAVGAYLLLTAYQRRWATATILPMAAPNRPRMLYFYSETCGACRIQAHYLAQLDDLHRALVQSIEVEREPELARQYQVLTLPTTILIDRDGHIRYINPGVANPFKLTRQLEDLTKI